MSFYLEMPARQGHTGETGTRTGGKCTAGVEQQWLVSGKQLPEAPVAPPQASPYIEADTSVTALTRVKALTPAGAWHHQKRGA
jgi:hypothetical protein